MDTPIIIALISTIGGFVATAITLMVWLVKNSEKRQDNILATNQRLIQQNAEVSAELSRSIASSADASRSLEESIRRSDEREHEFQREVIQSFKSQSKVLQTIVEKADRNHAAIIKQQNVKEQVVAHQTVMGKENS